MSVFEFHNSTELSPRTIVAGGELRVWSERAVHAIKTMVGIEMAGDHFWAVFEEYEVVKALKEISLKIQTDV